MFWETARERERESKRERERKSAWALLSGSFGPESRDRSATLMEAQGRNWNERWKQKVRNLC